MNYFQFFVSFVGVTKVQILYNQMSDEDLATVLREQNAGGESTTTSNPFGGSVGSSTTANPFGGSVESTTTANPFGGSMESSTTANPIGGWGNNPLVVGGWFG